MVRIINNLKKPSNSLSLEEQQEVLWKDGEFLDNHITEKNKCNVYSLYPFFVEVVYDSEHNVITELRSFKTGHLLDKYSIDF